MITKTAIFDLDGTLIDSRKKFVRIVNGELVKRTREPLSTEQFLRAMVDGNVNLSLFTDPAEQQEFWRDVMREYSRDPELSPLFAGGRAVLRRMVEDGFRMAVVTNRVSRESVVGAELDLLGVRDCFLAVKTARGRNGDRLSKTTNIRTVLRELASDPEFTVFISDWDRDLDDARAAGVRHTVGIVEGWSPARVIERCNPSAVIPNVAHLIPALEKIFR